MMRKYFKESFEAHFRRIKFKTLVKKISKDKMNELAIQYIVEVLGFSNKDVFLTLVDPIKTLVLCDRYNKGEDAIEDLDFSSI